MWGHRGIYVGIFVSTCSCRFIWGFLTIHQNFDWISSVLPCLVTCLWIWLGVSLPILHSTLDTGLNLSCLIMVIDNVRIKSKISDTGIPFGSNLHTSIINLLVRWLFIYYNEYSCLHLNVHSGIVSFWLDAEIVLKLSSCKKVEFMNWLPLNLCESGGTKVFFSSICKNHIWNPPFHFFVFWTVAMLIFYVLEQSNRGVISSFAYVWGGGEGRGRGVGASGKLVSQDDQTRL